eukprot:1756884-Amphidinium_carterae.1
MQGTLVEMEACIISTLCNVCVAPRVSLSQWQYHDCTAAIAASAAMAAARSLNAALGSPPVQDLLLHGWGVNASQVPRTPAPDVSQCADHYAL